MNSTEIDKVIKEHSKQYIVSVRQWENGFKNAIKNFLTSDSKRFLLIEIGNSKSCAGILLHLLEDLQEDLQNREVLKKYLGTENQTFISWEQLLNIVEPLESIPHLTNLLVCEFENSLEVKKDDPEILKKIIDFASSVSKKVIFISSKEGTLNKYLEDVELRKLTQIDEFNKMVTSWIHHIEDTTDALWESASCGRVNDVKELLKNGFSVNYTSRTDGCSALHVAAEKGYRDVVLILLKYGAVNLPDASNITPLHLAAKNGNKDIVLILAERGIDLEVKDKWGNTAIQTAYLAGHYDVVNILKDYGEKQNING